MDLTQKTYTKKEVRELVQQEIDRVRLETLAGNRIEDTDTYKFFHPELYPEGMTNNHCYLESRGFDKDRNWQSTGFFGLQYFLKRYWCIPLRQEEVEEARKLALPHCGFFPYDAWTYVIEKYGGYLPLRVRAVPEGTIVPAHNALMTIELTVEDDKIAWLPSWFETQYERIWYPITVQTQSIHMMKNTWRHLVKSSDTPEAFIKFMIHDFGSRGSTTKESAEVGGAAHLAAGFLGTDNVVAMRMLINYYNARLTDTEAPGYSVCASEHSTVTAWGKDREREFLENQLRKFGKHGTVAQGNIVSLLTDTYDVYNTNEKIIGEQMHDEIVGSETTCVSRPDSGDPIEVDIKLLNIHDEKFGSVVNRKDHKVLNHMRILQGDGINEQSSDEIFGAVVANGFSAENMVQGSGGGLLQKGMNRDTCKMAYKSSNVTINGESIGVHKTPVTDTGKRSKKGRQDLIVGADGAFQTVRLEDNQRCHPDTAMVTYFENGVVLCDDTLDNIRDRVAHYMALENND
jgi:nicotinamide phosphoribosyltransferase